MPDWLTGFETAALDLELVEGVFGVACRARVRKRASLKL
jgi:hypothetical protein